MKTASRVFFSVLALIIGIVNVNAQSFTLQGKVTDEDMNPVELATVAVLSQGKVTFTNLKG